MIDGINYEKVVFGSSFGPIKHVQVRRGATWNIDSGKEKLDVRFECWRARGRNRTELRARKAEEIGRLVFEAA